MCCACALLDSAKGGLCGGRAAVCCARAQANSGGVLSMVRGTALFDTVAISDTRAEVRAGRGGDASRADGRWGGCRRTGCGADCGGRGCVGGVQYTSGGVVCMGGGAVLFKGGTISNAKAVSLRMSPFPFACCLLQMLMLSAAFSPTMLHAV